MSGSQTQKREAETLASLYIDALRQGEALWFRVASGSMDPLLRVGDEVRIEPVAADKIRIGQIAAFETDEGLVIHRIVRYQQTGSMIRLLEMSDVHLHPRWVEGQSVVGRAILVRRTTQLINLRHPIAQMCGFITAQLRYRLYRLYTFNKSNAGRLFLHGLSRIVVFACYWCVRSCSAFCGHKLNVERQAEEIFNVGQE